MSRKFVLIALGAMMSAPAWAQTAVATAAKGRNPLDTMRAMLQRRNPTVDEVLAWSADIKKRLDEFQIANERARREMTVVDEVRARAMGVEIRSMFDELSQRQRLLAEACALIRPHQGESEGVLGFQILNGIEFQRTSPVIKEERFVRTPEIMFVDPNSPAAKSEVREGDLWIAIEGKELVGTYVRELSDLLKPGARVELKLRRDGRDLNVGVVARKRPDYPDSACNTFEMRPIGAANMPQIQFFNGPLPGSQQNFFTMRISKSMASGAVFGDLTNEKRSALKAPLNEGVLVDNITPGSPAELAGLREFDVVTRVNNEVIESIADFTRVTQQATGSLNLWVYREGVGRKVVLPTGR